MYEYDYVELRYPLFELHGASGSYPGKMEEAPPIIKINI